MKIACCIWALSEPETDALRQVRDIGFDFIDIQPMHQRTMESQLLAQELGLRVSCVGASFGMPTGTALDHPDSSKRDLAVHHVRSAIAHAADIGAEIAYVIPGSGAQLAALERYQDSVRRLAADAAALGIKLAVEHFPGTALSTAAETLEFIRQADQENLYLLYDSGHIQMSGEDPATVIANAGDALGYVHFDDNDGVNDLHWSLLDGVMTDESLLATLRALGAIDYAGALSLELSPALANPKRALSESRDVLMRASHRAAMPR
ncbi:MAG: sugar phosphate isomerase/epimerase [Chloroflexota bacterium]|nr:sugar phosphate isomerase/epimerase [Chloroflexota bacterium]